MCAHIYKDTKACEHNISVLNSVVRDGNLELMSIPGMVPQVCLAAVMAQVGAWVPAESMQLSLVDALFVRSGARDAIMSGQVSHHLLCLLQCAARPT